MKTSRNATIVAILCMSLLCFLLPLAAGAKVKRLSISSAGDRVELKNFHITDIKDQRLDTTNIGYITTGANNFFLTAAFDEGLEKEFAGFLQENTKQNQNNEGLSLRVFTYKLFEKTSFKGAEIGLTTHFALYNKTGGKLFDYVITETRNTGMNMGAMAGELMCRNLVNFLNESDKNLPGLLTMYKNNDVIKVNYFFDREPEQKNLLPYNPQRPLNVFNFVAAPPAKPTGSSGSVSGLRITYQIRNLDGKPEGFIELLPYFDQAKSWLLTRENAQQNLKYQQIRFKIAAYVANELLKDVQGREFRLNTFHNEIDALKQKYYGQIADLQAQFDTESGYGSNAQALDDWNRKVAFYDAFSKNMSKLN